MKKLLRFIPELFFIISGLSTIIGDYLVSETINKVIIVVVFLFLLQLVFQKRVVGLVLGAVFGLIALYMMFAVLSEFHEFETFSTEAFQLLAIGLGIFGIGFLMAFAMIYKFSVTKVNFDQNKLAV
ncbi:hypothetical protein D3C87_352730 [compost metagenome]